MTRTRLSGTPGVDDALLVARAQTGDGAAFADLLRMHGAALHRLAMRYTRNAADADDVVQDAAVMVWRNLQALREPERVRAWMLQITAREALKRVTSGRHDHELTEDVALLDGPDRAVDRFDLHDGLRAALRALPEQQAAAWLLREVHRLSYREIGDRLGAEESSVRGWLVLARKRIQRSIDEVCPSARPRAVSVRLPLGGDAPPVVQPETSPVATHPAIPARSRRSTDRPPGVAGPRPSSRGDEQPVRA